MTIAHLSDTHLGFRAYSRLAAGGANRRETDVMNSFVDCLKAIAERDPDLVVHAGDLFHVVRPSNATIVRTYQAIVSFQRRRGGRPFVLIGGNHDTPRTAESGNILALFAGIEGLLLASREPESFDIPELDLEVLAIPSHGVATREASPYEPRLGRRYSLLTLHGMTRQALPDHSDLDVAETQHERWTYVALGDYHTFQPYGRNVCYSGSTDFASTNIWDEAHHPKGWVWFDGERGIEHVPVQTRKVIDLPRLDAAGLTALQVEEALRLRADWPGEELPIVRQKVSGLHPAVRSKLDPRVLREIASRALNYQLQPVAAVRRSTEAGSNLETRTLETSWTEHLSSADLPPTIDRMRLQALGLALLKEAGESEAGPS